MITVEAEIVVDDDAVARCTSYVNFIRDLAKAEGGELFIEQKVSIEHITGEVGATGTADAVIVAPPILTVADLKSGSGRVNASTKGKPNKQLSMYADGALEEFGWMGEFTHVRMVIVQPRLNHVSELTLTVAELREFTQTLRESANETRDNPVYKPSSDNCHFCDGRFTCEARQMDVLKTSLSDFDDLPAPISLGALYAKIGMIKRWCEDTSAAVYAELSAGRIVEGFKLITGNKGDRAWSDAEKAEAMLATICPKQMYSQKLISPTAAGKLVKVRKVRNSTEKPAPAPIGPQQWVELQALIVQPPGKPEVVSVDDPRTPVGEDLFSSVSAASDDANLFN